MSSITAISVAYNSESVLPNCLRALKKCSNISSIIVVDNCSKDNSASLVTGQFPQVNLITNHKNEGFGRGNNVALETVNTDFALLVNPDAVVSEEAITALLKAADDYPEAAILAPQLKDEEGTLHLSYKRRVFAREKCKDSKLAPAGDLCADYLSGAVWLVRMKYLKQIGFFDPNIFLFYEDDDLCLRVRHAGFSCVLVAGATVTHLKGASSDTPNPASEFFKQKQMIWSRLYLEQKYQDIQSAKRLACKLQCEYAFKMGLYTIFYNRLKRARYRGRLAGVKSFNQAATQAPAV